MDELTCPTCGKTGTVQGYMNREGGTLKLHLGLGPEGCEGCRTTLERAGYVRTEIPPEQDRMVLA